MAVRVPHDQQSNSIYFVTFTCYNWHPLIEITNSYDAVYKWFDSLYSRNIYVTGYVIMPNHIHVLLFFPLMSMSLNTVIGNAKRFLAYEIVNRLKQIGKDQMLDILVSGVKKREARKGQIHKVFQDSFDAKDCHTTNFIFQKLDYMHRNPVTGKWQLVDDFAAYHHSSASYYECGITQYNKLLHINDVLNGKIPGSPRAQAQL